MREISEVVIKFTQIYRWFINDLPISQRVSHEIPIEIANYGPAKYGLIWYLHFRILKFPCSIANCHKLPGRVSLAISKLRRAACSHRGQRDDRISIVLSRDLDPAETGAAGAGCHLPAKPWHKSSTMEIYADWTENDGLYLRYIFLEIRINISTKSNDKKGMIISENMNSYLAIFNVRGQNGSWNPGLWQDVDIDILRINPRNLVGDCIPQIVGSEKNHYPLVN